MQSKLRNVQVNKKLYEGGHRIIQNSENAIEKYFNDRREGTNKVLRSLTKGVFEKSK